ncbi:endonuclease/exonuclease/phosphatase family protein [Actinomadura viridis]|uniref:Endonuclease/exonuclease/phosphatase family metal-dependent hydrolase n=1 Tax=Actinomadura viridis TaxID=58110 RepID=A0A931DMJ3_9ACTN|nr:endonuclease/exonuclease/phosphatase family protein [Actinomadura viridis]MBG6090341.1 endonuclease/exonuclease/phosphatase family metal-dependent hydrolase [Actinomadura viridis]
MPLAVRAGARRRLPLALLALAVLVTSLIAAPAASAGDTRLRVMTYNVRLAADAPPKDWPSRLPLMKRVLRDQQPDLLGVQEALWQQMRDLDGALPGHDWIGMGRQGGTRDEFSAVFYRKDRFEVLDFDHVWLSGTPQVIGSATWGNRITRMVTWAKFRDRRDGTVLYHVNTHFDHQSENARVKSAELILERVRGFEAGAPVILTGDFNAAAGKTEPYRILTGADAFTDTWETARRRGPAYNTFGGWKAPVPDGDRIDWILSRGPVETRWAEIDAYQRDGLYPSDHYPVVAHVTIGKNT